MHALTIAPEGGTGTQRYQQVLLPPGRLREAIDRLNPQIPGTAREDTLQRVLDLGIPALLSTNRHFHKLLVGGVPVQYQKDSETGRPGAPDRLGRAEQERVAGGQSVLHQRARLGQNSHTRRRTSSCL